MINKIATLLLILAVVSGCSVQEQNVPKPDVMEITENSNVGLEIDKPLFDEKEVIDVTSANSALTLSMRQPITLNPLLNEDVTVDKILSLMFEPLAYLDEARRPTPNLFTDFNFSQDGKSLTITLKDDVFFSDGEKLNADDLIFSLKTLEKAPENAIYKNCIKFIDGYEVVDNRTVVIHYVKSVGDAHYYLNFPVIPRHHYENADDNDLSPVGSGIYKLVNYRIARNLELETNENYFKDTPYIDKINVIITPDFQTDIYAFKEGVTDVLSITKSEWGKYSGSRDINSFEYLNDNYEFLGINHKNSFLANKNVRQALNYATPVSEIVSNIFVNQGESTESPVVPSSYVYDRKMLKHEFNLDKSKYLLLKSGYSNLKFKLLVNDDSTERIRIAEFLSKSYEKIGVTIDVEKKPFAEYEELLKKGDFDLFLGGFVMELSPQISFAFHSSSKTNGLNVFSYSNSSMDTFLNIADSAPNEVAFLGAFNEIEHLFADDLPVISIAFKKSVLLTSKRIGGEIIPTNTNPYYSISKWTLKDASQQ